MRYRLTFTLGVAVGYVLGTRAGRERYDKLRAGAQRVAQNPAVRNAAESAAQTGRQAASKAVDSVTDRVGHRMPAAVHDRVQAFRHRRGEPLEDDWGTSNT
ncbi:YtxH domain-containing protein [Streptomyces sp. NPDC005438]|uniref:YtxH domain-containing protein n=1 Tax=Streptomyces sp. NPDC005438 TaxID=3156880 RepID=UPI0033A95BD1